MGSYCELTIGNREFYSSKSWFDPEILKLFRPSDKRVYRRKEEWDDGKIRSITAYEYRCSPQTAALRLHLMGFSLDRARRDFAQGVRKIQKEEMNPATRGFLRTWSFEKWLIAIQRYVEMPIGIETHKKVTEGGDKELRFIHNGLQDYYIDDEFYLGFPTIQSELYSVIRAFLQTEIARKFDVVFDYTELVHNGYYSGRSQFTPPIKSEKIVVLLEGSSDKWIIEESLRVLYPDFIEYFSFLDFEISNLEGGAANLVRLLKGFIGAKVPNRIVAVFDNDTAAQVALRGLHGTHLPNNFRILRLPELACLRNYPTVGPHGRKRMNINGLAGSIELYLEESLLKNAGRRAVIQWTGYDKTIGQYQGEIIGKAEIQDKYKRLLHRMRTNPEEIRRHDFSRIKGVINGLFEAYNKLAW